MLHIQLLGAFDLRYQTQPVTSLNTRRLQSLLAYLLLHDNQSLSRQQIAFAFWPESSDAQAQNNLRQILYTLRQRLPMAEQFIQVDERILRWRADAPYSLDVKRFTAALERSHHQQGMATISALEKAVAEYKGNLLPTCYEDWILPERERLSQMATQVLEQLILLHEEARNYKTAIVHAQRLLHHDPLHEEAYRRLMRLYALAGDRAAALRIYHTCVATLQNELQVEPSVETREAYEHLLYAESAPQLAIRTIASALIGREREWQTLQATWRIVNRGATHLLCFSGEAGIGKSRLAEEMAIWCQQQGIAVISTRAYAAEGGLAYAPVAEALGADLLQSSLAQLDASWLGEIARLRPQLFEHYPNLPKPEPSGERWQRQRLFEALARVFTGEKRPLLLVLDDLQWFDSDTLEWLHYLLRFDRRARLLIIGTLRTEEIDETHPVTRLLLALAASEQLTEIVLAPLDAVATAALANHIAERTFDSITAREIYRATEGNPLFIVETVRANLNNGEANGQADQPLTQVLPPKVQAAIQTRLAQLSTNARELARLAAVIGRSFSAEVLAVASEQDEVSVVHTLDELWQRRIVREQGANGYDFSHDRIREVAYAQNSRARRRLLHRRVAAALERVYGVNVGVISGQLAIHYDEAGLVEQAIAYYGQAAEVAEQRFARTDEVSYLRRVLALLDLLPENFEHQQQRLRFYLALGTALSTVESFPSTEVRTIFNQAIALSQQLGQTTSQYNAQRGLYLHLLGLVALSESHDCCVILLQLAHELQNPILLFDAYQSLAHVWYLEGEFARAHEALTHALEYRLLSSPDAQSPFVAADPGELCALDQANMLALLGYADQARSLRDKALAQVAATSHPFIHAVELYHASLVAISLREPQLVAIHAAELTELTAKFDLPVFEIDAAFFRDWSAAMLTQDRAAVERLRQCVPNYQHIHSIMFLPLAFALLAEAEHAVGQNEDGLVAIDQSLAVAQQTGERYWNAEIYRLRGELLLAQGAAPVQVEACFVHAIEIARQQAAKTLELRTATSLARLWQSQGKQAQARQMLSDLYTSFTEGFDTADLRAAKELLAQLY